MSNKLSPGTVHEMPKDLADALSSDVKVIEAWEKLTPLARNEWICWVTFVKQDATRQNHVQRAFKELKQGKRRPCCWIGCIHRPDKAISPSVKYVLSKRQKAVAR